MGSLAGATVIERLMASLQAAARYNPSDAIPPDAVLWTDHDLQWQSIIPQLRQLLPHLLTLGDYRPGEWTGPAIWLRSVVDGGLGDIRIPDETVPVVYLPGVSRQQLRAVQECPDELKPLVELQYRGVCWTQKNGKDWTVEAFLVAEDGGLGLDVARDAATRRSMLGALTELAATSVERLRGKRLESEDFDRLFSDDPARDVLLWLSDPQELRSRWNAGRWGAFRSRCRSDLGFDPDSDGELVAAEMLGRREDFWGSVWQRFAESPALYPGIPDLLRKAMPGDLFVDPSSWPQNNEKDERALRQALVALRDKAPEDARARLLELEEAHRKRRDWVWARLGDAPLANSLAHLVALASGSSNKIGGQSLADMAKVYLESGWQVDAAALHSMAVVRSAADCEAVTGALTAVYRPWLDAAAEHLQALVDREPLTPEEAGAGDDALVAPGGLMLFADGLRYDVSQILAERMRAKGWSVAISARWAALPSVTATAKPAVSPVATVIKGLALGEDFTPVASESGKPLTTDRFRKLLCTAGYQYLAEDETGDPAGRAWTENGDLDRRGHSLQAKLAASIDEQIDLLLERIEALLGAGWQEVRIVTDHGWLWLPGGLPKVELPRYLTASRWARCAAIKGGSKVAVPTVPWHWNEDERVAMAPGIACFNAGNEYAHGGLSLQECLVPDIRVTPGTATSAPPAKVAEVTWAGLRCRVKVEGSGARLSVDLRTKVNEPASSVSTPREVDAHGAASLLIADEALEGTPLAVVVLDASGHVVAKQSTIIGGES